MDLRERRRCRRYPMHYPVIISSVRAIDREQGWHEGEILDAGRTGIRMRVDGFGALAEGTRLQLICQPATAQGPNNRCLPVPIEGLVVWENAGAGEFALRYLR